jgi:LemA protein
MPNRALIVALFAVLLLSGCGYNTLQSTDEQIKASWAEVLNQYKRRSDLIPNLVNTVKAYAAHEQQVLLGVTNARAKVGSLQVTPELINDPQAFERYMAAQREMSGALARLLAVAENYPQLKADQNFRDLQAQLEGTENRINVERSRYNEAAQAYNTTRLRFPAALFAAIMGFQEKAYFRSAPGSEQAPNVNFEFGRSPAPAAAPSAP